MLSMKHCGKKKNINKREGGFNFLKTKKNDLLYICDFYVPIFESTESTLHMLDRWHILCNKHVDDICPVDRTHDEKRQKVIRIRQLKL